MIKKHNSKIKNHKAILFTIIAIVILVLMVGELLTYVELNVSYNNLAGSSSYASGSAAMIQLVKAGSNAFLSSSLQRAISALAKYEGTPTIRYYHFINNTPYELETLMLNGTIYGNSVMSNYMNGATLKSFTVYMEKQSSYQNINLNLSNVSINVYQSTPFYVNATLTGLLTINSTSGSIVYPIKTEYSIFLNGTPDLQTVQSAYPTTIKLNPYSPNATLVSGFHAIYGSTSPYLFASAIAVVISGTPSCSAIPSSYQNSNYILITTNALDISQNVCGMAGLVSYSINAITPLKPFLVYATASNILNLTSNNMNVIIDGGELGLLNISSLTNAASMGSYFASRYVPSYLDRAEGFYNDRSPAGIYSFNLLNRNVAIFNGQSSYISSSNVYAFPLTNLQWIYPISYGSGTTNQIISSFDGASANQGSYSLELSPSGNLIVWNGATTLTTTLIAPLNKWSMVGFSITPTSANVYINNLNQTLASSTYFTTSADNNLILGYQSGAANKYFDGSISNVQLYNSILYHSQIQLLYQAGIATIPFQTSNLSAWWPLSASANDYSGYNNNGIGLSISYSSMVNYTGAPILQGSFSNYYTNLIQGGTNCGNISQCSNSSSQHIFLTKSALDYVLNSRTAADFNGHSSIINGSGVYIFPLSDLQWVYPLSYPSGSATIISAFDGAASNSGNYKLELSSSGNLIVYNGATALTTNLIVPINKWSLAGFQINLTSTRIYLGTQNVTLLSSTRSTTPSNTFWSLGWANGASNYFNGSIEDVQIYNALLTQSQLRSLTQAGISGYPIQIVNLSSAWWQLDDSPKLLYGSGTNGYPIDVAFVNTNHSAGAFSSVPNVAEFNGQSSLYAPIGSYFHTKTHPFSVSALAYLTPSTNGPIAGIASSITNNCGSGTNDALLSSYGLTVYGGIWGLSQLSYVLPSPGWYNLVITYDPSGIETLYVNANAVATTSPGTFTSSGGSDYFTTCISGSKPSGVNTNFTGSMADVQLYRATLSQAQVTQLYLNDSIMSLGPSDLWQLSGGLNGISNVTPDYINTTNNAAFYAYGKVCTNSQFINGACGVSYGPP